MLELSKPFLTIAQLVIACIGARESGFIFAAEVVDTSHSQFAVVRPVGFDEVHWTEGFWADRVRVCREKSIPAMWDLMKGHKYKPFLEHFLIAAGRAEGDHHGAKWNDGDFYKWLEAAIATVAVTDDSQLKAAIDQSIEAISQAQSPDGYIHTPVLIAQRNGDKNVKPFQDRHAFEMYNMGHLMTTGCLHYRVTGEKTLLDISKKAADYLIETFRDPTPEQARNSICPSHYMGAVELYRTTGDERYLELAKTFLTMRNLVTEGGDDNQDRIPFVEQREAVGHAVRENYLCAGAADLYAETGEPDLLVPLESIWENMAHKKMYITGASGALYDGASPDGSDDQAHITRVHQAYGRNYQLPNTTAHNETCANIANLMWSWRMFQISGDAKYLDVLELALYNSILSGVSLSGTEYFYVNPLRVVDPLPTELRYPRTRQPFFVSFCCPPNLLRTIAELSGYVYSMSHDALWLNLYGANTLSTELLGKPLQISQETEYPWNGTVKLQVEACPEQEFALNLRIPGWTDGATVKVNDKQQKIEITDKGFFELLRPWKVGDRVELDLPMPAKLIEANPLVEETTNQVAFQRGPIVYCLESVDLPKDVELEQVLIPRDISLHERFDANFLQGVILLEGTAVAKQIAEWGTELYREVEKAPTQEFQLRLIPYYAWANRGPTKMSVWLPLQ
ncbi:glycoside hydrolase family 127 protein [Bythopirellula polymerisocia]|uniref:Non-reducing end beta-L-arabinofuranosidase n=1 Tax=Bythopirellula polymerisocia TaxID=2528003 RepID=A0A5C6CT47_9BACT|nr:glycoside hydrolase family 127 protein [Bythopirellula polymerisocia]TWU27702.1 Non-reducing end beta-L-arabinofuranosidase [Bythopirellula polymerisocia]